MSPRSTRRTEAERVEVMLCVLPWLAAEGGAPLAEIAAHFGEDPEQLRTDLLAVFYDVEPELGGQSMVEVTIDEEDSDFVSVRLPGSFEEPPNLDQGEALMLLAAGTAMSGQPGADRALEPALVKLEAALGPGARNAVQVELGRGDPDVRRVLDAAQSEGRQVEITYFSWYSDEVSTRTVDPWALRSVKGHWYLTGWCHERDALRHFRLDRVLSAREGDATASPAPEEVEVPDGDFAAAGRQVILEIPQEAAWAVDSFPIQDWQDREGVVEVTLGVHDDTWLDRLLLRLPPEATARDASTGEDLGVRRADAARRILRRHGVFGDDGDPR